eukprot:19118-Chlamydomonas_euryale.AAC.8
MRWPPAAAPATGAHARPACHQAAARCLACCRPGLLEHGPAGRKAAVVQVAAPNQGSPRILSRLESLLRALVPQYCRGYVTLLLGSPKEEVWGGSINLRFRAMSMYRVGYSS